DRIEGHYADDASVALADVPTMSGKTAIRAGIMQAVSDENFALVFEPTQWRFRQVAISRTAAGGPLTTSTTVTRPPCPQSHSEDLSQRSMRHYQVPRTALGDEGRHSPAERV